MSLAAAVIVDRIKRAMSGQPPPQLPPKQANLCYLYVEDDEPGICCYCGDAKRAHTLLAQTCGVPPADRPWDEVNRSVAAQITE